MLRALTQSARKALTARTPLRAFAADAAPPAAASTSSADIDWDSLTSLITTDDGKRELAGLKAALSEGADKLAAKAGKSTAAPNFESFAADVDPAVLGVLKSAYAGLKLPTLDAGAALAAVDGHFAPIIQQAKDLAAASTARLAALDKEVKAVEADIAKLSQATVDDELAADPAAAAAIDADIAQGKFY